MSTSLKEMNELLALKRRENYLNSLGQHLNPQEIQKKMQLGGKNPEFMGMSIEEMDAAIQKRKSMKDLSVSSKEIDLIVQDYMELYPEGSVENKDGKTFLTFPSQEEVVKFCKGQAEKERLFKVVDNETNKVLAYSNGDGELYNGDGTKYSSGDFKPSTDDAKDFIYPSSSSMQP